MQHAHQSERLYFGQVGGRDAVGHEDKLFIVNLIFDEVADPVLVGQVKKLRHDRLHNHMTARRYLLEEMPQHGGFLIGVSFLATVAFGGHEHLGNRLVLTIDQRYVPFFAAELVDLADDGDLDALDGQERNVFFHFFKA